MDHKVSTVVRIALLGMVLVAIACRTDGTATAGDDSTSPQEMQKAGVISPGETVAPTPTPTPLPTPTPSTPEQAAAHAAAQAASPTPTPFHCDTENDLSPQLPRSEKARLTYELPDARIHCVVYGPEVNRDQMPPLPAGAKLRANQPAPGLSGPPPPDKGIRRAEATPDLSPPLNEILARCEALLDALRNLPDDPPGGQRTVRQDGSLVIELPDGRELIQFIDGTRSITATDGLTVTLGADGDTHCERGRS